MGVSGLFLCCLGPSCHAYRLHKCFSVYNYGENEKGRFVCVCVCVYLPSILLSFYSPLPTNTHTHTHTHTHLLTSRTSVLGSVLSWMHCSCSGCGLWHVLPPLYIRSYKRLPQLLAEDAPLVQLWQVPCRKDLHPDYKCFVGWYIGHVIKDDQQPVHSLLLGALGPCYFVRVAVHSVELQSTESGWSFSTGT